MLKYVVDVEERDDPAAGVKGYRTRFEFEREVDASVALARAALAGLEAHKSVVRKLQAV